MNSTRLACGLIVLATLSSGMRATARPSPPIYVGMMGAQYTEQYWNFYPTKGAADGEHKFDGIAPDRSIKHIDAWINFNKRVLRTLPRVDIKQLDASKLVDFNILKRTASEEIFKYETLGIHRRRPMYYDISWGLLNLIQRDYAPLEKRMEAATKLLQGLPAVLDHAKSNLDPVLPKVFCRVSIDMFKGSSAFIRGDVLTAFAGVEDAEKQEALNTAAGHAADAIDAFVAFLESERMPSADDAFAIGEAAFVKLLSDTEGVGLPIAELRAIGQRDLERNLTRAKEIADAHFEGKSVGDVMNTMKSHVYANDELVSSIAAELESFRQFCVDKEIITIPSDVRAHVTETPAFARWASAMMDTPGAYETTATEAYYYVTTVDPEWTADEQRQWLADFNKYVAANVSVHEAYPGHYVQYLHTNRSESKLQKVFVSYSGAEGWAHYTEQMMIEQGFGADDPLYEIAQIQDALLRNCRFICAIDMHTAGMTVEQATEFFMKNTFLERVAARREAERGTFDPEYFKYTLGKLQILKLRDDFKKKMADQYTLKRFHDELLSHGMPTIPIVRERMLGPEAGPSL